MSRAGSELTMCWSQLYGYRVHDRLLCGSGVECYALASAQSANLSNITLVVGGFKALVALLSLLGGVRPSYAECSVLL